MTPRRSDAAERILEAAMQLFAEKGYERTSVPDIQKAAGLAPGSGALYKHFPSKEAVLQAGMKHFIEKCAAARAAFESVDAPPLDAFPILARRALASLDEDSAEVRIAWRELEQFPDLQATVRKGVMQEAYRDVAAWLAMYAKRGDLRPHDSEAVAAVLLGSLSMFSVFASLWGEKAIPVSDKRFVEAWTDVASRALAPEAPKKGKTAKKAKKKRKPSSR